VTSEPSGPLALRTDAGAVVAGRVDQALGFWARFRGLMGRRSLAPDEGLYLPESSIHMFFMRFAIDALFVAAAGAHGRRRVVAVRHRLPPWRGIVMPVRGAEGVIELPAGSLERAGVQVGDEVWLGPVGTDARA
jgi:hypothetical protein